MLYRRPERSVSCRPLRRRPPCRKSDRLTVEQFQAHKMGMYYKDLFHTLVNVRRTPAVSAAWCRCREQLGIFALGFGV